MFLLIQGLQLRDTILSDPGATDSRVVLFGRLIGFGARNNSIYSRKLTKMKSGLSIVKYRSPRLPTFEAPFRSDSRNLDTSIIRLFLWHTGDRICISIKSIGASL